MDNKYIDIDGNILRINQGVNIIRYYNSNGQIHRLDGPAYKDKDGSYQWCKYGKNHRIGGPAIYYYPLKIYRWYINGKYVKIYYIYG